MIELLPLLSGQAVTFWICAVIAIVGAVGVVASSKPVYSALCLALVMVALAAIYASLQADFLFAVQIIVYTGAVLMLFLFVIMLVGVSSRDHLAETLKGHRVAAIVAAVALVALLALATGNALTDQPVGLDAIEADGYLQALAQLIFQRYVIAFEATAALLITAAVAAMVLAHPKRLRPKPGQAALMGERLAAYAASGRHPGPLPASGVTAQHNSLATPALLPDGAVALQSVSATVASRMPPASPDELIGPLAATLAAMNQPAALPPGPSSTASPPGESGEPPDTLDETEIVTPDSPAEAEAVTPDSPDEAETVMDTPDGAEAVTADESASGAEAVNSADSTDEADTKDEADTTDKADTKGEAGTKTPVADPAAGEGGQP
ncbi:MAG: NADH-quinone oxidoreductase subunit J [Propionibacteriaceae bacterium]|jgi:NADH-quinone oxidoreductase subunit J|nr:NADH-quinone oxidoreductase subunit J [Propionibacteriaceae bacterium]